MLPLAIWLAATAAPLQLPYADAPVPLALATLSDRLLAGLEPQDSGQATLLLAPADKGDGVTCAVASVTGSPAIGPASCALARAKLREMAMLKRSDGLSVIPERMTIRWRTEKEEGIVRSDFGGATPITPQYWLTSADYPGGGGAGHAGYAIGISSLGLVTDCRIVQSSGNALLDERTCKALMRRARFMPALDKNRKPVPTKGTGFINWAG